MKSILVVEDDPDIKRALSIRIQAAGYEVHTAMDAVCAFTKVEQVDPDLMIVDISMPIANGFDFIEQVRTELPSKETPFIVLTASKRPEYKERALSMGASAFLEKPYDSMQLIDCIDEALADLTNWS